MKILNTEMDNRRFVLMLIGSTIGIGAVTFLSQTHDAPLLIASFGATAVLIYGAPDSPFAKPWNVFFGHLLSAVIGVSLFAVFGCTWYAMTLAVTLSIAAMTVTGTLHPPGGATALVCVQSSASVSFILFPVMAGVLILMMVAFIMKKMDRKTGRSSSDEVHEGLKDPL